MKVLLTKDVKNLGKAGDIKDVSNGHAKNFLFPNNLASAATPELIKKAEQKKALDVKKAEEDLQRVEAIAAALDGLTIKMTGKANEEGKLFGSINPAMIIEAVKKENKEAGAVKIEISSSIKETGEHKIVVNLPHGLESEIIVIVEKE